MACLHSIVLKGIEFAKNHGKGSLLMARDTTVC